jgi:hypothetical protein
MELVENAAFVITGTVSTDYNKGFARRELSTSRYFSMNYRVTKEESPSSLLPEATELIRTKKSAF